VVLLLALIRLTLRPALQRIGISLPRHPSETAAALIGLGAILAVALAVAALCRLRAMLRSRNHGPKGRASGTASTRLRTQEFYRRH
jgi:hypothetical protein